jgi:hypothetical protein
MISRGIHRYFTERYNAMQYAKKYWDRHLVQASLGYSNLWDDLKWLAESFNSLNLHEAQAERVVGWLEVRSLTLCGPTALCADSQIVCGNIFR